MKIAILGFGREGKSLLKFLRRRGLTRTETLRLSSGRVRTYADKDEIWVLDKDKNTKTPAGVRKNLGKNYLKNIERFDVIFRSPGIPYLLSEIQKAEKQGVKISSATKLFFELANERTSNIIGITGTKGKGTTSTLLYKTLKAAGDKVFLAGNIGKPALDILPKLKKNSIVILELSSFQLQDLKKSPHIAIVLDIFPDHLDAHKNLKEYYDAKANIARYQKPGDKIFFFSAKGESASGGKDNALSRWVAEKSHGKKIPIGISHIPHSPASTRPARRERGRREWWNKNKRGFEDDIKSSLKILGAHNFKNAVMAATVAKSLGVSEKIILKTVKKFHGLPYRTQFTKKIRGVNYYNDSASTNPSSTIAALKSFTQPVILICGGASKNIDFKKLGKEAGKMAKKIILFGQNKKEIRKTIKLSSKVKIAGTLYEAVKIASFFSSSGDIILFSPASTSFDMFKNYEERGMVFDKIIKFMR